MSKPEYFSDFESERVEWLWRERIPKGMITVVAGKPSQGKGLFSCHLAADISRRGGTVLISSMEDHKKKALRPRLVAAGARLDRVINWRFHLPSDFDRFADLVFEHSIELVIVDPLAAILDSGTNRHSDNIRDVLNPLTDLIEVTGTAVVVIEHALKRVSPRETEPLNAIAGSSSGLPAAARAGYLFGIDPNDRDRRILAYAKGNLREPPKAIAFELDVTELDVGPIAHLIYDDECEQSGIALIASDLHGRPPGRPPDKRAEAAEWLTNYLIAAGKPVKSTVVFEDALQYGMASRTLRRAADDMGIVKSAHGGPNVTWWLPQAVLDLLQGCEADGNPVTLDGSTEADLDAFLADTLGPLAEDGEDDGEGE